MQFDVVDLLVLSVGYVEGDKTRDGFGRNFEIYFF
jgi:hypothetical protein